MQTLDLTSEQIKQLENIIAQIGNSMPQIAAQELEYKVYYNDDGSIVTYTTENIPGKYIVITREQWAEARHDARVIDGQLVYTHIKRHVFKLERVIDGKYCSTRWDVNILSDGDDETNEWDMKAYDIRR